MGNRHVTDGSLDFGQRKDVFHQLCHFGACEIFDLRGKALNRAAQIAKAVGSLGAFAFLQILLSVLKTVELVFNDFYARDGSRRVRTGYRQKQKEGIVTIPPFGYFKDKNTKKVVVVEEAAETVRLIFSAYVGGSGMKAIARTLNEQRRKTPALMQAELLNKRLPNTQDGILKEISVGRNDGGANLER